MKTLWTAVIIALLGLVFAGCANIPDEGADEEMWSTTPRRGFSDPDAMDEDR